MNGALHFKQQNFRYAQIAADPINGDLYTDQYMIRYAMTLNMAQNLDAWLTHLNINPPGGRGGFNNQTIIKISDWYESLSDNQKEEVKLYDLNDRKEIKFVSRIKREFMVAHFQKWLPEKEHPRTEEKGFDYDQVIIKDAKYFYSGSTTQVWNLLENFYRKMAYTTNDPDYVPTIAEWYDQLDFQNKKDIIRTPR
jgi:hypothetical protein